MAEFRLGPHSMCNILKLHHFAFLLLSFYIPSLFFYVFPCQNQVLNDDRMSQTRGDSVVENSHSKKAKEGRFCNRQPEEVWPTSPAEGRSPDRQVVCVEQGP